MKKFNKKELEFKKLENSYKLCPFCGEKIKEVAIKCRFCNEWIKKDKKDKEIKINQDIDSIKKEINKEYKIKDMIAEEEQGIFLKSFSIGAMFGVPWYSIYMKYYLGLIWTAALFIPIPFAAPIVALFFGGIARKKAWESSDWSSFEEFKERSKKVETFSIILFVIGVIIAAINMNY